MMQKKVAAADDLKDIVVPAHPGRDPRGKARVFQIRAVDEIGNSHEPGKVHRAIAAVDVVLLQLELANQELLHLLRAIVRDLEAHLIAKPTRRKFPFQGSLQIVDFLFVDEQIGIPRHPKLVAPRGLHAREQIADVLVNDR